MAGMDIMEESLVKQFDTAGFADALNLAMEKAQKKTQKEIVLLTEAQGRILFEDIKAKKNLPSFDNSAMDGFAFRYEERGKRVHIAGKIFAGEVPEAILQEGECYKIMTGAQLPEDVDSVVPFEQCQETTEEYVLIPDTIKRGSNVRKKGEEIGVGEILIHAGTVLEPAHIALLSAQGIMAVEVTVKPKIVIIATGDEIKEPWEEANEDEIYNANAFGIKALLQSYGFDADYAGAINDDYERTVNIIGGLRSYDVIITTGGISKGDADFIYKAFLHHGFETLFQGVRIKPGHPVTMGTMGDTFVMGMPGNPLATMLTTHAIAIPVLYRIAGAKACYHAVHYAKISQDLTVRSGRVNMIIGRVENGIFTPIRNNRIGSGMITPLCESSAVIYPDESTETIRKDTWVKVVSFGDRTRSLSHDTVFYP
jgi:molybdopterin molybdotransferase